MLINGVARWFGYTNFIAEKKIHSNVSCYIQKWVLHWSFKFWVFSGTCRQKLIVEWHWLKFFLGQSVSFLQQTSLWQTVSYLDTGPPSLTTLTMNGFTRNAKHGFNSWKWSILAWKSFSRLTIYFCILPLCGLANSSSQNSICSHSDIWKMTKCFWQQYVSLKKFNFFLGT